MKSLSRASTFRAGLVCVGLIAGCGSDASKTQWGNEGGRRTARVGAEGGQTGSEGGCVAPMIAALDFSVADVRALVDGTHHGTFGYIKAAPLLPNPGLHVEAERDVSVSARLLGDPKIDLHCGGTLRQRVEVKLAFEDPALDIVFERELAAFSGVYAVVQVQLESSIVEALHIPGVERSADDSSLMLAFTPQGLRGKLELAGTCDDGLMLPSTSRCYEPTRLEVDAEQLAHGLRPAETVQTALQTLYASGALPLEWDDGTSTTLSIEASEVPSYACGDWAMFDAMHTELDVALRAHVTSADGRVDVSLPALLSWTVHPQQGLGRTGWDGSWTLHGWVVLPPAALHESGALPGLTFLEERAVQVGFHFSVDADQQSDWGLSIETRGRWEEGPVIAQELPGSDNIYCYANGDAELVMSARKTGTPR